MGYNVEISKSLKAVQGLKSPVLASKNLSPAAPPDGFEVVLRVGIRFEEVQLTSHGWFVDTDAVEDEVSELCSRLSGDKWTNLFDFRPTFEQVARWVFNELRPKIKQIDYVELENARLGVKTRYSR